MIGPDEACYSRQVATIRERGVGGFQLLAERFVTDAAAASLPSPVRWLWIALCALFGARAVTVVSALLTLPACWWLFSLWLPGWAPVLVACGSPLLWTLAKRSLQDVTVSLLTILSLGAASIGSPWALAAAVFALLATKEAAVFALPAVAALWLVAGYALTPLTVALCASLALWLAATRLLLGRDTWRVFGAAGRGHDTEYTRGHQRGTWHRLWVDLALVSPWPLALFVLGVVAAPKLAFVAFLLVSAHSLAPIQNVRTALAADLVIRGLAGATVYVFSPWWLVPMLFADAVAIWNLRNTYDPVTATLTAAFGMSPRP